MRGYSAAAMGGTAADVLLGTIWGGGGMLPALAPLSAGDRTRRATARAGASERVADGDESSADDAAADDEADDRGADKDAAPA